MTEALLGSNTLIALARRDHLRLATLERKMNNMDDAEPPSLFRVPR